MLLTGKQPAEQLYPACSPYTIPRTSLRVGI